MGFLDRPRKIDAFSVKKLLQNRGVRPYSILFVLMAVMFFQPKAFAGGGLPLFINFYEEICLFFGVHSHHAPLLVGSLGCLLFLTLIGILFQRQVRTLTAYSPDSQFSLRFAVESIMDFVYDLTAEQCGHHTQACFPFLFGLFSFLLVGNLSGLVPGLPPPTEDFSANLAVGIVAFLFYNFMGFKEHGFPYLTQLFGPFWSMGGVWLFALGGLFFCIETVSHLGRPFSLSLRLTGNIFGDHLLYGVFSGMIPLVAPSLLLFFGLLVSCIQSFVFTLLVGIYINMAVSHDH